MPSNPNGGVVRVRPIVVAVAAGLCSLAACQSDAQPNLQTVDSASSTATSSRTELSTESPATPTTDVASESNIAPSSPFTSGSTESSAEDTSTPSDDGLSEQEQVDRASVEAQWIKSWDIYRTLQRLPEDERQAAAATVAVDPALSLMLDDAKSVSEKGWDTYGTIGHRISWPKPIDGSNQAVISDCQDGSQAGSLDIATGAKKTVGVERALFQGAMRRGDDGVWRLERSYFLKDEQC